MHRPERLPVRRVDRLRKQRREETEQRRKESARRFALELPRMESDWKRQLGLR